MGKVRNLFKHTFVYSIGLLLKKAIGFFLIPIYTKALPPSDYGILSLCYLFIAFFVLIFSLGLNDAFFKFFTKDKKEKESVSTLTIFRFIYSTPFLVLLIFFAKPISFLLLRKEYPVYIIFSLLIVYIEDFSTFFTLILRAEERSIIFVILNSIRFIVNMVLNIFFVVKLKIGVMGILLGDLISLLLLQFMTIPYVYKFFSPQFDKKLLKDMIFYGFPLLPLLLLMMLLDFSDRYIINFFWGNALAGIYSLGYQFGTIIQLFIYGFRFAWAPFFFKNPDEKEIFSKVALLFLRIGLLIWCGVVYFTDEIFGLFVDKNYHDAKIIVPIVGLGYVFYGIQQIFITPFYIHSRTFNITIISTIGFLTNLILNLIFIPKYGMIAAASTTLFSFFITCLISLYWGNKIQKIPYRLKNIGFDILIPVVIFFITMNSIFIYRILGFILISVLFIFETYYERRNNK